MASHNKRNCRKERKVNKTRGREVSNSKPLEAHSSHSRDGRDEQPARTACLSPRAARCLRLRLRLRRSFATPPPGEAAAAASPPLRLHLRAACCARTRGTGWPCRARRLGRVSVAFLGPRRGIWWGRRHRARAVVAGGRGAVRVVGREQRAEGSLELAVDADVGRVARGGRALRLQQWRQWRRSPRLPPTSAACERSSRRRSATTTSSSLKLCETLPRSSSSRRRRSRRRRSR